MRSGLRLPSLLLSVAAVYACSDSSDSPDAGNPPQLNLHVPSPDWSEQVVYFVFTDRFANGDPSNDDQGQGEFEPSNFRKYSGGDLQGIIDQLDYIQGLGATAVWITPPVANQWWDPIENFGGFHGYWARDLKSVDEHQGDLETYQRLSAALHDRGMYLIQDIVPNHMGNFYSYNGPYDPNDPTQNFVLNPNSVPTTAPTLPPFDQIDVNNPAHRDAAIYHFTPSISDFQDGFQETNYQLSNLDDLNTANPVVRDALRDAYGYWIREVGIDGVRIDTVKFIEVPFWNDFLFSNDSDAPGLERVAEQTGRTDFLTFGEVFDLSRPFETDGEQKLAKYINTPEGPGLDGQLQFPLFGSIQRVLTEGRPTAELGYRIEKMVDPTFFPNPSMNPTFLDNHDVQRFLSRGSEEALRQGITLLMTLPGIPVLFQGTEQGFEETRASLFAAGWESGGRDHYDTDSSLYTFIASLAQMRRSNPAFTKGDVRVLRSNVARAGALGFARRMGEQTAIVLMNTAASRVLMQVDADLSPGTELEALQGPESLTTVVVPQSGRLIFEMDPGEAWVLQTTGESRTVPQPGATVTLDTDVSTSTLTGDVLLTGRLEGQSELRLVLDDDLARAARIEVNADGTWTSTLSLSNFSFGVSTHTLEIYAPEGAVATPQVSFTVDRPFDGTLLSWSDPVGDDVGPTMDYVYPQDSTFTTQMDITNIQAEIGSELTLRFEMASLTRTWSPPNQFDHVSFTIFFDLPDREGISVMPLLNGSTPDGFLWDRTHFAYGWSNEMRSTEGASESATGTPINPAPLIESDLGTRTISFTYSLEAFGLTSWDGVRVYMTTWDFDGIDSRYRFILPEPSPWDMSGPNDGPKIMDAAGPYLLEEGP